MTEEEIPVIIIEGLLCCCSNKIVGTRVSIVRSTHHTLTACFHHIFCVLYTMQKHDKAECIRRILLLILGVSTVLWQRLIPFAHDLLCQLLRSLQLLTIAFKLNYQWFLRKPFLYEVRPLRQHTALRYTYQARATVFFWLMHIVVDQLSGPGLDFFISVASFWWWCFTIAAVCVV